MGARNVSAAFAMWAHLDHAPFRVLVGMALMSLDQASAEGRPARVYFGGEDALVELLGRSRSAAYRALGTLRKEGAVEVVDVGRKGHRAVYKLALDPLDRSHSVALSATSKGRGERDGKGRAQRDQRVAVNGTPRSTEEETGKSRPGETSPPAVVSPAPDAPVDNPVSSSVLLGVPLTATPLVPLTLRDPFPSRSPRPFDVALSATLGDEYQRVEGELVFCVPFRPTSTTSTAPSFRDLPSAPCTPLTATV